MTREEQTRHKKGLRRPYGLTIDRDCNIVVMNRGFNKLEIYSPEGQLMMSLGGEGSEPGHFTSAGMVVLDRDANLVVCDLSNGRLQIFG